MWEDGRLRQIEVSDQSSNSLPFPGAVVGRGGIFPPPSLPPPSSSSVSPAAGGEGAEGSMEFRSPLLRGRGRTGRQRGRGKGPTPFTSSSRSSWQREGGTPAFRMPEFNAVRFYLSSSSSCFPCHHFFSCLDLEPALSAEKTHSPN